MDTYRAIVTKRDTRAYTDQPIDEEVLMRILQAGRMAGSSKNTQPIRFVVMREQHEKDAIAACGHYAGHVPSSAVAICVVTVPGGSAFDAGRAAQNMMVAAWAEGITSCPTSMHEAEKAREVLGLPPEHAVSICLSMGYPAMNKPLGAGRPRLPLDQLVHWGRWEAV